MKPTEHTGNRAPAILYVDDESRSTKYFERIFSTDYPVFTATNAKDAEALLALNATGIGVLISDQRMPDCSGVQLLERVKSTYPHIVRLLTTAYADMDSAIDAVNRGEIHRYILKPWDLVHLRTELRHAMQMHQEQQHRSELLYARRRTMLTLASQVAHELRTPLASIRTAAGNLKGLWPNMLETYRQCGPSGKFSENAFATMERTPVHIQAVVDRANLMINVLLMNAREDAGPDTAHEILSITGCARASLDSYPFRPGERQNVSLDGEDFTIRASDVLLTFVFYNLILNALDAIRTRGQGDIRLLMEPGEDFNRLRFTDTGTGIAPDVLPHVFDEFYSGKPKGHGTGMGLPFCRRVMTGLGGDIQCRSRPDEFTEILLRFPPTLLFGDHDP